MNPLHAALALALVPAFHATQTLAEPPIPALLITGRNNHNWPYTSRIHQETLEATGRFRVTITEHPEVDLAKPDALRPYKVVILDYNADERWPAPAEAAFSAAVKNGLGVVAIHAADNAFPGWEDYETMLALLWRKPHTGHGNFHAFDVQLTDADHPITNTLSPFNTTDELYHNLVNPRKAPFHLLAQAMSSKESNGTGKAEPVAFTSTFGQGRIFSTPLGHVWVNADDTKPSVLNDGFRTLLARGAEWAATGSVTLPPTWSDSRAHNTLTDSEKADGWKLLFDGQSPAHWHAWKQSTFPTAGWSVADGTLMFTPGHGGGDIATNDEFSDFEFSLEWRVGPGGNSGIMYRSTEDHAYPWETGREFQILDDARHQDGKSPKTRAGTMYAVAPLSSDTARPANHWNHARIVCKGTRIEHWLNHVKVVDIDTASPDYAAAVAASKFKSMPDYGKPTKGRISLQDHGDPVWFRNIKVRALH